MIRRLNALTPGLLINAGYRAARRSLYNRDVVFDDDDEGESFTGPPTTRAFISPLALAVRAIRLLQGAYRRLAPESNLLYEVKSYNAVAAAAALSPSLLSFQPETRRFFFSYEVRRCVV